MISFVVLVSLFNLRAYFVSYAPFCRYESPNTRLASLIGSYVSELDTDIKPYLLTAPTLRAHTHLSMEFLSSGRTYQEYLKPLNASPDNINPQNKYVFFITPTRNGELKWIEQILPDGEIDHIYDCNLEVVTVYLWEP